MTSGVYGIENTQNGHQYIGSSADIVYRWRSHRQWLRMGEHCNPHLQNAWTRYGEEAFRFVVLEECLPVRALLVAAEQRWLNTFRPEYNICQTAGSPLGVKRSAEVRAKNSAWHMGKKHSPEVRAKNSAWHMGKKHSPEARARMSASHIGKPCRGSHTRCHVNCGIVRAGCRWCEGRSR